MSFRISSPAFENEAEIPVRHTCEGQNVSPALEWSGAPAGAVTLALLIEDPDAPDPDAPRRTWTHWVLYDIPASAHRLPEGVTSRDLPDGARQGLNDSGNGGYDGPCPPIGSHRYFHKLFALDAELGDLGSPRNRDLRLAMEGHVLAETALMGTYRKRGS